MKKGHINRVERTLVHGTFRVTPATHPIAQLHAFIGMYARYPRERDGGKCAVTDLREPAAEIAAARHHGGKKFFARLVRELSD